MKNYKNWLKQLAFRVGLRRPSLVCVVKIYNTFQVKLEPQKNNESGWWYPWLESYILFIYIYQFSNSLSIVIDFPGSLNDIYNQVILYIFCKMFVVIMTRERDLWQESCTTPTQASPHFFSQ